MYTYTYIYVCVYPYPETHINTRCCTYLPSLSLCVGVSCKLSQLIWCHDYTVPAPHWWTPNLTLHGYTDICCCSELLPFISFV